MCTPVVLGRTTIFAGISALALLAFAAAAQSPRILEQSGNWVAFEAAGWLGYTGNAEDGSRVEITSDLAHSLAPGPGGVSISISGSEPRAGAVVRLSTEGESIDVTTAAQPGWIDGRGCPGCEADFRRLWSMIRSGNVLVIESEGRRGVLPLRGTARLMPAEGCPGAVSGSAEGVVPGGAVPEVDIAGIEAPLEAAPVGDALGDMTFACDGTLTPTQAAICADPALRLLDADLAEAQRLRLATASATEAAQERQMQPIRSRMLEACGSDAACIEEHYVGAIASIRMMLPAAPAEQSAMHAVRERVRRDPAPVIAAPDAIPEPLTAFRDCEICPEMMALPAGSFWMGATEEDARIAFDLVSAELPRREVTLDYTFAIGRFTVTVAEFAAFVQATGHEAGGPCYLRLPDSGPNAGHFVGTIHQAAQTDLEGTTALGPGGMVLVEHADFRMPGTEVEDDQPATCISRNEAMAYLAWLSEQSGRTYRLPTEAEWEYAVRAGETRPYFWGGGQAELCGYGNFADRDSVYSAAIVARCAEQPSLEYTYPVGSFEPNAWGLHDMVGNVFEFVEDCFFPDYHGAPADGGPWLASDGHPEYKIDRACRLWATRGYFFDSVDIGLRSAARCIGISSWDDRSNALGLRVAVSLSEEAWDLKRAVP